MALERLSTAQWQILRICWDLGEEFSGTEVWENYTRRYTGVRDYRTVGTLLKRLVDRGYLASRADGRPLVYRVVVAREMIARSQFAHLLDELGDDLPELEILQQMVAERIGRTQPPRRRAGGSVR